jgi:hypothetical protein
MLSVLDSCAVYRGFEDGLGQPNYWKIANFCSFYTKHTTLRSKRKDRFSRNHDNVSVRSDMSNHRLYWS